MLEGDHRRACTIVDVSRSGVRVRLTAPVAPRSRVMLLDERVGALEGSVVWCRGDMAGVSIDQPSPEVAAKLRALLAALEQAETQSAMQRPRPQFGRRGQPSAIRK